MFAEVAEWIERTLGELSLPPETRVADVGSSTLHYRTVEQPHIERQILAPLRDRGAAITHVDAKHDVGVDHVFDLDANPPAALARELGSFDLVLCNDLLIHVADPQRAVAAVAGLVRPDGAVLAVSPHSYRRTVDPRDNGLRVAPSDLVALFREANPALVPEHEASIEIVGPIYYKGIATRASWIRTRGGRWIPLPGAVEQIRRRTSRLRWRESCVLLRRAPKPEPR